MELGVVLCYRAEKPRSERTLPMEPLLVTVSVPVAPRDGMDADALRAYADALVRDVEAAAAEMGGYEVRAVRVVGECPQLMAAADLGRVLHALRGRFAVAAGCEVVVDAMPGRLTADDLGAYRDAGVTSLAIDVRTTQGREAKRLDRACDVGDGLATVLLLQREGFESYGVRIGCGFAEQTEDSFRRTLNDAFFMEPDFVFVRREQAVGRPAPSDDALVAMRAYADRFLRGYGYAPQVAGLYAKPAKAPVFDRMACEGAATLGVGLGSESCYEGLLYRTTPDLERYLAHAGDLEETCQVAGVLDPADQDRRRVAGLLHLPDGMARREAPSCLLPALDRMAAAGTLELVDDRYRMTPRSVALGMEPVDLW